MHRWSSLTGAGPLALEALRTSGCSSSSSGGAADSGCGTDSGRPSVDAAGRDAGALEAGGHDTSGKDAAARTPDAGSGGHPDTGVVATGGAGASLVFSPSSDTGISHGWTTSVVSTALLGRLLADGLR